jgi:glycosyltransferase involved in cell wall biosynthesis
VPGTAERIRAWRNLPMQNSVSDVARTVRVLMVASQLPRPGQPGTMAPAVRQIESIRALGVEVQVLPVRGAKGLKYVRGAGNLRSLTPSVDLIHAHYGYSGWLARTQIRKPVIVTFLGDDLLGTPDLTGRMTTFSKCVVRADRWLAHAVDAVIVVSAAMARVIAPVKAYVIPQGVDLNAFCPMDMREAKARLGLADHTRYVLFPGRPEVPRKAFPLAQTVVKETARRTGKPLELLPLGRVEPSQVPLYMNACAAMVLTSFSEGSPNVVKEAMACNRPIVSVPVGDVSELLAGVNGCAICPRDVGELSAALADVLQHAEPTNGRIAVEQKGLDLPSVARKIVDLYADVLSRKQACAA